jgi:hypothetical protein
MDKKVREKALNDIIEVIINLTREINHQTIHLKPLAVFGGAFESVIPYFWNDVEMDKYNCLMLDNMVETIESYNLGKENYIATYSGRINTGFKYQKTKEEIEEINKLGISKGYPATAIRKLTRRLHVGEDNKWYLDGEGEGSDEN